eukprot:GILI01004573.1.p1 GENE.GILI01004573.1~~GILI01004573.1.p1  ORF type:complete len:863 (+),score=158.06 GILI01004573.1:94-2682(+)
MSSLACRSLIFLISGLVLMALAVMGLYLFSLAVWFSDPGPYIPYNSWQGYDARDFTGLVLFTFCTTIGITLFVVGLQSLSTVLISHSFGPFFTSILPTTILSIGLITIAVVSAFWANETLRCGYIFCTIDSVAPEVPNLRPEAIIGWKTDLGIASIIASLSLMVARVASSFLFVSGRGGVSSTRITLTPSMYYWACAIIVPILSAFYFYLSATIPNSWEYHSAPRLAAYLSQVMNTVENCPYEAGEGYCPEVGWAWFTTNQWQASSAVVLKIFPGNLFFFGYLMIVGTLGIVAHQIQWSRKALQRRIVPPPFANIWILKYALRFTVGDAIIAFLTAAMLFLFSSYWIQSHNFNGNWSPAGNLISPSERWARALGQIAVVILSLLLFPASRTSILHHAFGTHWEAFLWTHRVLGTLMLLTTIGHMTAWYVRFNEVGLFPSDIFKIPMTLPSTADNWTVPLVSLTSWFLLLSVGIGALPVVRRRFFEAFYYLHILAAYSTIPAVLWHAAAGFEFMLPGLTIWFIDRAIRFFRSGTPSTVIDITVFTNCASGAKGSAYIDPETDGRDVLEIRFRPSMGMTVHPGQYVFLNVPQISILEWHPYTVSTTGTSSDYLTVHMKGMGVGTWSDRVIQHCRNIQHAPTGLVHSSSQYDELNKLFQLNVDGPYGSPIYYNDYDQVLLIAGGIGITPCASILTGLRAAQHKDRDASGAREGGDSLYDINRNSYSPNAPLISGGNRKCKVRRVVLKWSVRCLAEVDALGSALACSEADLPMNGGGGMRARQSDTFEQRCTIHATRGLFLDPPAGFDVQQGRPNYDVIIQQELLKGDYLPSNTLVFVCGPSAMMDDAVRAATAARCHVHNEVFEL